MKKIKKRMTGEERKRQIVKVAASLFAKNGFKGTTTRGIAEKASISEAVIFRHFKKKQDLYKAIIDARCSDDSGSSRLMNAIRDKKGRGLFREVAVYLLDEHRRDPSFMRLLIYSALENQNLSDMFIRTRGLELIKYLAG
ncbi:MAG: TetR/AcrR family transcriptional regulator, partial [Deltaproteobacteria bacterium]|nr:TetR/AcrR family transcriptional regulator [Deltaproteobacteria bacterium]